MVLEFMNKLPSINTSLNIVMAIMSSQTSFVNLIYAVHVLGDQGSL